MTIQYFIDSENVGDFWIPLLELPAEETELIVFYTRNSPHMSYDSLIRLKESDRTVTFIKCYEGTNALDFQLVSELGYQICRNEDGRFVIVTNDTGFDAAVKYWRRRKKPVKRITGKECRNLERRLREDLSTTMAEARTAAVSAHLYTDAEHDAEQDVHADAFKEKTLSDTETRSSRPNLRDAERAAQPDPDDHFPESESGFMADADIDDADREDAEVFAYDPDADEMEEAAYEAEQDDLQDDAEFEDDSDDDGDDEEEIVPAEDVSEDADEDDSEEDEEESEESLEEETDSEEDAGFDGTSDEEDAFSENIPADDGSIRHFEDAVPQEDEDNEETAGDAVNKEDPQTAETEAPEVTMEAEEAPQTDVPLQTAEEAETAPETKEETDFAEPVNQEAELDESWFGSREDDSDPAADAAHRSRSRRSRSRRSKSTSRKQEQAASESEETANEAAAEEVQNGKSSRSSKNAGGKKDSRKTDAVKTASETEQETASDQMLPPEEEEIARIVACIGPENLAELHNQLATFYGDQGKDIYLSIKNNARSLPVLKPDLKQKFAYYCEIIFRRSDYAGEYPSDISEYLLSVREKLNNLNSLRYALQKHYGKEKGRRFYFLLKPFAKTMYQM